MENLKKKIKLFCVILKCMENLFDNLIWVSVVFYYLYVIK